MQCVATSWPRQQCDHAGGGGLEEERGGKLAEQVYQEVLIALVLCRNPTRNVRHIQTARVLGLLQAQQLLLPVLPGLPPPPLHPHQQSHITSRVTPHYITSEDDQHHFT